MVSNANNNNRNDNINDNQVPDVIKLFKALSYDFS